MPRLCPCLRGGCTAGMVFTAGPRMEDPPTSLEPRRHAPAHERPKNVMAEIKAHEGSVVGITGLMKKGQHAPGVAIGGGVRVSPGSSGTGGLVGNPGGDQITSTSRAGARSQAVARRDDRPSVVAVRRSPA